jgi:hypothetical protein
VLFAVAAAGFAVGVVSVLSSTSTCGVAGSDSVASVPRDAKSEASFHGCSRFLMGGAG